MMSTLTSKGQITIPVQLRDLLGLECGDRLCFEYEEGKPVIVKKHAPDQTSLAGILRKKGNGKKLTQKSIEAARDALITARMEP